METIQQLDRLETLLNEIPTEVRDMYKISIDTFMSDVNKLYIKGGVWMTLLENQIERVLVQETAVSIYCTTIVIILMKDRMNVQIVVY